MDRAHYPRVGQGTGLAAYTVGQHVRVDWGDGESHTARVLELWRCANLVNLLSFHAIDPTLYSIDGFVVPVASAFGDPKRGGMLPEEEVTRKARFSKWRLPRHYLCPSSP